MLNSQIGAETDAYVEVRQCLRGPEMLKKHAAKHFSSRPVRSGMWFLAPKEILDSIQYLETLDIYEEFFSYHPNCDIRTRDFVAIKLSADHIKDQSEKIVMSSYRWNDVKGVGRADKEYEIPANYGWFLSLLKEEQKVGWIDFVANIGVNVPTEATIEYMSGLYAELPIAGSWLYSLLSLQEGLKRGWIYQESAFGRLHTNCLQSLFKELRGLGITYLNRGDEESCHVYFKGCQELASLLVRRGISGSTSFPEESIWQEKSRAYYRKYGGADGKIWSGGLSKLLRERRVDPVPDTEERESCDIERFFDIYGGRYYIGAICVDFFTMPEEEYCEFLPDFQARICEPLVSAFSNATTFLTKFNDSILRAYVASELTYESDRDVAVTNVARYILRKLGQDMSAVDLLAFLWKRTAELVSQGIYVNFASEVNYDIMKNPKGFDKLMLGGTFIKQKTNNENEFQYYFRDLEDKKIHMTDSEDKMIQSSVRQHPCMRIKGLKVIDDLVEYDPEEKHDGRFRSYGVNGDNNLVELLYCTTPMISKTQLDVMIVATKKGRDVGKVYGLCMSKKRSAVPLPRRDVFFYGPLKEV
jgi:hypothetical protein